MKRKSKKPDRSWWTQERFNRFMEIVMDVAVKNAAKNLRALGVKPKKITTRVVGSGIVIEWD